MPSDTGKKQRKLGRGLSALMQPGPAIEVRSPTPPPTRPESPAPPADNSYRTIGAGSAPESAGQLLTISVDDVGPSPFQPRTTFDQGEMARLADSIRHAGVIQPVLVRRAKAVGRYELVAGERRWRAAQLAGVGSIPALLVSLSDEEAAEWALVENLQRTDLNMMERARALRSLSEHFHLTQTEIAERVGLERPTVANLVRLTELEDEIQVLIETQKLSAGHGKALLSVEDTSHRLRLARRAAAETWSVRRLEEASRKGSPSSETSPARVASPTLVDLERRLGQYLGTRVRINTTQSGTKGRVSFEFYSLDHFDGLMQKIHFDSSGEA